MKASLSPAKLVLLSIAAGWIVTGACNGKVNDSNPSLLTTVRVSLSSDDAEGNLDAVQESIGISNDGRYISFTSKATNLVPGDTNNAADVFLRDNRNRTLTLVSVSLTGGPSNGVSGSSSISGDGRYVTFVSEATNLTIDVVTPGKRQIYVRDMVAGVTTLISRATGAAGQIALDHCGNPKISNDGTVIVFDTLANNLDGVLAGGDDNDAFSDVYRRQWIDGTSTFPTDLVSFASGAAPAPVGGPKGDGGSSKPVVSADGRYVAFESSATNLVTASADGGPDLNGFTDVFVRDTQTFRTVRCSVEFAGANMGLSGPSQSPSISLDGMLVAFRSISGTLSQIAQEQNPNIYVRSWFAVLPALPFTEVLSVHTSGATGGQNCDRPSISGDGTKICWQSPSPSLVNGDSNGVLDVFLRNRTTQETTRQSVQTFGGQLDGQSGAPSYSADGRYIVFWSQATNGVDDDANGAADIYMRGPPFK